MTTFFAIFETLEHSGNIGFFLVIKMLC